MLAEGLGRVEVGQLRDVVLVALQRPGFGFWGIGFGFCVSGFGFRVSNFRFRV